MKVVTVWLHGLALEGERLRQLTEQWGGAPLTPPCWCVIDEPDAVASRIWFRHPVDVPVLRADDPRLDALTFEVTDDATGRPIPSATLHMLPTTDEARIVAADAKGRIVVRDDASPREPGRRLLARLAGSGTCVRAPGYVSHHWGPWYPFHGDRPADRRVSAADLVSIAERGAASVRLRRYDSGATERTVTLLDEQGAPARRTEIRLAAPQPGIARYWGAFPWTDTVQLTADDGSFRVPRSPHLVIEARIRGFPVSVSVVDTRGEVPMALLLPRTARVSVAIEGVPAAGAHWTMNPLDSALTPMDGPPVPPTYGVGVRRALVEHRASVPAIEFDAAGELPAGRAEFLVIVPVGVPRTLWFGEGPWPPLEVEAPEPPRKVLEVLATRPGPFRIEKKWTDLPMER